MHFKETIGGKEYQVWAKIYLTLFAGLHILVEKMVLRARTNSLCSFLQTLVLTATFVFRIARMNWKEMGVYQEFLKSIKGSRFNI